MTKHRIYTASFASVYPHYVAKAERKGRTKAEVDELICWLTGYGKAQLEARLADGTDHARNPQSGQAGGRTRKGEGDGEDIAFCLEHTCL